jgi:hypothetical protein
VSEQGGQSQRSQVTPGEVGQKNDRNTIKSGLSGSGEHKFSQGNQPVSSKSRAGTGLTPLVPDTDRNPGVGSNRSVTVKSVASRRVSRALSL